MITCTLKDKKYAVDFISGARCERWSPRRKCMPKS